VKSGILLEDVFQATSVKALGKCGPFETEGQLLSWAKVGGDVFAVFSSIGAYSNHGAWGLEEFNDSEPANYPKLDATLRKAKEWGQPVEIEKP